MFGNITSWYFIEGIRYFQSRMNSPSTIRSKAAMPEDAITNGIRPCDRTLFNKVLYKKVFPVPPGPSIKNALGSTLESLIASIIQLHILTGQGSTTEHFFFFFFFFIPPKSDRDFPCFSSRHSISNYALSKICSSNSRFGEITLARKRKSSDKDSLCLFHKTNGSAGSLNKRRVTNSWRSSAGIAQEAASVISLLIRLNKFLR